MVCFAPLGTHLPAVDMTLVPRDIGGVTSEGMLCSEREMGLVGETS
jgi:phenylalanyl-tRNA synthetase beta chain